jgi:hypothetical protein
MIILGHEIIPSEEFVVIYSQNEINSTKANSTIFFNFDIACVQYCCKNNISCGVYINDIKSAIFANALGAKYLIVTKKTSSAIQKVANEYMFDSKVLQIIKDDSFIEEVANNGIDGVVYEKSIKEML